MFNCRLWRFAKRDNSTKSPFYTQDVPIEISVELKDSCSIVNPVLKINPSEFPQFRQPNTFNYCYLPPFSRFYFIDDWVWNAGLWYAVCHVDVLATYRDDIMSANLYVMRSTYDSQGNLLYNGDVSDSKYPTTAEAPTYLKSSVANPFAIDDQFSLNGTFVVGIVNAQSQNGAVTYYAFTPAGFLEFCQKLFNYSSGWLNIDTTEISEDLQKALVNPFQYVVSCIYLPIDISRIQNIAYTSTNTIYFGWWSVTLFASAILVNTALHVDYIHMIILPRHPQAATRGNYLNVSPYTIYTLAYYPFGTINIDTEAVSGWRTLDVYTSVDVITGKGIITLSVSGKNNPIRTVEAQVGVSVPTASLQTSYTNLVTGKTALAAAGAELIGGLNKSETVHPDPSNYSGVGGFFGYVKDSLTANINSVKESVNASGGIKQVATDIFNTAIAASTTAEIQGMQGCGGLFTTQDLTLSGRFLPLVSEDLEHTGRPLMELKQISTLSGFCIVKDADLPIFGTEREKATVKAYLEGGFFVE